MPKFTIFINCLDRIIRAISKKVIVYKVAVFAEILNVVGINKSAHFGVVVTGIKVVEFGFGIVVVAAVSERVNCANGRGQYACYGKNGTPSIIIILSNNRTACVNDCKAIALQVLAIVIIGTVIVETDDTRKTVEILDGIRAESFFNNLITVKGVIMFNTVYGL